MVAGLALEPRKIMSEITKVDAPALLHHPVGGSSPPPPVREDPDVVAVHEAWARIHAAETQPPAESPSSAAAKLRIMARDRLAVAAAGTLGPAQSYDRELIGDLIRATDALARRCDELGGRLAELEALVEEVVAVFSEDMVQVRALLTPSPADSPSASPADSPSPSPADSPSAGRSERPSPRPSADPEVGLPEVLSPGRRESPGAAGTDG